MKIKTILFTLIIFISCSKNNFNKEHLSFELRLVGSDNENVLRQMNLYNSDQKFFVDDTVYLDNSDIDTTEVIDWETQPKVKVLLNDDGRQKFTRFTKNNIGKNAAMVVDSRLVSAPRINAEISSGELVIIGHFNHEEALQIAEGIIPDN